MKTKLIAGSLVLVAVLTLAGCVTPTAAPDAPAVRDVPMQTAFDPATLDAYRKPGSGAISGQAFLTTQGGDVKVGAGREVSLFPATAFFKEVITHMEKGYRPAAYQAVRPQFLELARRIVADAQGNFEFQNLPAGDYALEVDITWMVPGRYIPTPTGGMVRKTVTVGDGQAVRVMLTR